MRERRARHENRTGLCESGRLLPPRLDDTPDRSLGKYGLLRLRYLKEHRPIIWAELVMEGKLYAHLLETEDAAHDLLDSMMPGMAKEAGATEDLKARDPMRWVGLMNCCKAQVEEIIFVELVYS